jgi:putative tryptophan/tyrosine transport system substrate-binding protein
MEVSSADGYDSAFKAVLKAHSAAVAVTPDPLVTANFKLITNLLIKYRLSGLADRGVFVETGGLMSYGADQTDQAKRVVALAEKILKGTKPADIPVEQPRKFELVINLKTAKQIGLRIPPNVLVRADKVIK